MAGSFGCTFDLEMDLLTIPCGRFLPHLGDHFSKPLVGWDSGFLSLIGEVCPLPALSPWPLLSSHTLHGCLAPFLACRAFGVVLRAAHSSCPFVCTDLMLHSSCEAALEPGPGSYVPPETEALEPLRWSVLCLSSCHEISSLLWDICPLLHLWE